MSEDSIKIYLREVGWCGVDRINLASGELGNEPSGAIKCWEIQLK
jgi:hypothetical protein